MVFRHMATSRPQPPAGGNPARAVPPPAPAGAARAFQGQAVQAKPGGGTPEQAKPEQTRIDMSLIPASRPQKEDGASSFPPAVLQLPVELDVAIPVRAFRVRTLLALAPGHLIETLWPGSEDMPLAAGDVQLAWSEFEVIDTQLAVRITRLA
jgi:flagellar motor switch protein FliN/FliY